MVKRYLRPFKPSKLRTEYLIVRDIYQTLGLRSSISELIGNFITPDRNKEIQNILNKYSKDYNILLDVGAGVGVMTYAVANHFKKCICFEPSKRNFEIFENNLKKFNNNNITIFPFALGDKKSIKKFYSSVLGPFDNRFRITRDEEFTESYDVEINTLDEVLKSLNIDEKCLIKMDVEGSEFSVMKGAKNLLKKNCTIISEFWPWALKLHDSDPEEFVNYMQSYGYKFYSLDGKRINTNQLVKLCRIGKEKKYIWIYGLIIKKSDD